MGVLHSINHQDIKIYDSECGLYKDFILKNKYDNNYILFNDMNHMGVSDFLYKFINDILIVLYPCDLLITLTIQLIIRVIEKSKVENIMQFQYLIIICYRLAICIEYDRHKYEDFSYLCHKLRMDKNICIELECKVLKLLNYELYRDNVHHNLIDKIVDKKHYYRFICNFNLYTKSSAEIANIYSVICD